MSAFAASVSIHSTCAFRVGSNDNATAINAVPVLEDVYAGTTQEWSLRLYVPQHGKTHQVVTHMELTDYSSLDSMDHGDLAVFR